MLSTDLKMLAEQIGQRRSANGELHLSETLTRLVKALLEDGALVAEQMEARVVRPPVDLSDPKVALFPPVKARPAARPDGGDAA